MGSPAAWPLRSPPTPSPVQTPPPHYLHQERGLPSTQAPLQALSDQRCPADCCPCCEPIGFRQAVLGLPGEAEGRTSRWEGSRVPGRSPCRPGSAGQGCRGSEVEQTGCRPAGTEGPATERGCVLASPPNTQAPAASSSPPRSPNLKSFRKVRSYPICQGRCRESLHQYLLDQN